MILSDEYTKIDIVSKETGEIVASLTNNFVSVEEEYEVRMTPTYPNEIED